MKSRNFILAISRCTMKSVLSTCVAALTLFVAVPNAAASRIWYVNGVSGSNSKNCLSAATACKTIGHAISHAASGDSIMVASATYTENLTIGISLKVIGYGASTTIIDGGCVSTVVTIANSSAVVTLSNVTVRNGCAQNGGGIYNRGHLTIVASTISGNRVGIENHGVTGGGGVANDGTLTISNSTLMGNKATAVKCTGFFWCVAIGGGVSNGGTLTINNSTLSGNVAELLYPSTQCYHCVTSGGGIYGTATINNSTLSGNAAQFGGGIYGGATLQNSIVADNTEGNCRYAISEGYNLSSDHTCNFTMIGDLQDTNPRLGTLGPNGGQTWTIPLLSGSPAIDSGNPNGCTDGSGHLLKTDQRGAPRPDTEDRSGCDRGAFEHQGLD